MVGQQLGRETDAIAESAYKIKRRLCVDYTARDIIIRSAGKVVRPKPDQPYRRRRLCKSKTRHYYSTHNLASTVSFGIYASVNDNDHGRVVRIFVCLS